LRKKAKAVSRVPYKVAATELGAEGNASGNGNASQSGLETRPAK
jgi:glycine betaine/proline transport system permease protein